MFGITEPFLRSCQLRSHSRNSQHFMEPEGSLPCSQEPSAGHMVSTGNKILYCRACEKTIGCEKRFQVLQHLDTNIHKENIKIKSTKSAPVQKLLSEFSNNSFSQFPFDLHESFLAADIPLWKLTSATLKNFIEKYIQSQNAG
jgi:hypothetical protein